MMSIDPSNDVTYLCGNGEVLRTEYCDRPFSDSIIAFLSELSRKILSDSEAKKYADLATFAFYCRQSNLEKMKASVSSIDSRLGWGRALHIAPSNIPINFAYSFLFGLLAGNSNVVRLPSKNFPQISVFCELIHEVLENPTYVLIKNSNAFVRFSRESVFLNNNIANFDALLIWGGDHTIGELRKLPRAPRSIEIAFSDRYSFAVIGADEVLGLGDDDLEKLCTQFYNDTYLVDQNACSSPNLISWQGAPESIELAKVRFWGKLNECLESRYELNAIHSMDKQIKILTYLDRYPVEMSIASYGPAIVVATLNEISAFNHELTGVFGLFFELDHGTLADVICVANNKYQTLSYFGVDPHDIRNMLFDQRCKGIDRIVPIGSALDIGIVWDGYDLIGTLSRVISIR